MPLSISIPHSTFAKRRSRLRALLDGCDGMLVTGLTNVRYLTGFTGDSSYLVLAKKESDTVLVSDPRYDEQIAEQCPGLNSFMRKPSEKLVPVVCSQIASRKISSLRIEGDSVSIQMFRELEQGLECELVVGNGEVEKLRAIKDKHEIALIRRAVDIAERVFSSTFARLQSSKSEQTVAFEIEHSIRELGGEGCSFDPIVAVGPRSALPHAEPGTQQIGDDAFVLVDWGATVSGYRSDLTRVITTGRPPAKLQKMYEAVLAAQNAAISALRPGVLGSEVDRITRETLAEFRMEKRFNHGLGHGMGLDIHESPRMGKNSEQPLQAGMVVTIEPGVYYPGFGGVRIEDDVLITDFGCEVLSRVSKEFEHNRIELL